MSYTRLTGGSGPDGAYADQDEWTPEISNEVRDNFDDHEARIISAEATLSTQTGELADHETRIDTLEAAVASGVSTFTGLVLLEEYTITGTASGVSFIRSFTSEYDDYELHFIGVAPAVDGDDLLLRFSTDGGATFDSSALYDSAHQYVATNNTTAFSGQVNNTSMDLGGDASNAATGSLQGVAKIMNPMSASLHKKLEGRMVYEHNSVGMISINRAHRYRNAAACNAIRAYYPGGVIARGTFRMYGVAKTRPVLLPVTIASGPHASRPSAGVNGRLYLPDDGYSIAKDNGMAWQPWGPSMPLTAVPSGVWSWINQGSSTVLESRDAVHLLASGTSNATSSNWVLRAKTPPATPYTATFRFIPPVISKLFLGYGIQLRQAGAGSGQNRSVHMWWCLAQVSGTDAGGMIRIEKWTSVFVFSAAYIEQRAISPPSWFRVRDDGTNLRFSVSADGLNWVEMYVVSRTDWMLQGPDQVCFGAYSHNAATPNWDVPLTLVSYKET